MLQFVIVFWNQNWDLRFLSCALSPLSAPTSNSPRFYTEWDKCLQLSVLETLWQIWSWFAIVGWRGNNATFGRSWKWFGTLPKNCVSFPSPHDKLPFYFHPSRWIFQKSTVMIIAELNYSLHTDFVIGHMPVGWHSEHWHWLLVGILCWGDLGLNLKHCSVKIYLLNIAIIHLPPPSTRNNKQQNICCWQSCTSLI